jgi:hypothetical protein
MEASESRFVIERSREDPTSVMVTYARQGGDGEVTYFFSPIY